MSFAQTVTIGSQVWMTKNLNVDTFRNGDKIPEAKTAEEWVAYGKAGKAAWCYYDNDPVNGDLNGKLYNWYAVNDSRGIAPAGWHVPNIEELKQLFNFLGGDSLAEIKMKSKTGWQNNGNNESGFCGKAIGGRFNDGIFFGVGFGTAYWSISEANSDSAWYFGLSSAAFNGLFDSYYKSGGCGIRCIKD